jgi:hypothetical protein
MIRLYTQINDNQLSILKDASLLEYNRFLNIIGNGRYQVYKEKLIAICLCQGFAQHYTETISYQNRKVDNIEYIQQNEIDEKGYKVDDNGIVYSGIKDIDIWFFFKEDLLVKIRDVGNMRKSYDKEIKGIGNISIDFMKKGIKEEYYKLYDNMPENTVREYINNCKTQTAMFLRRKSIVGLYPESIYKHIIWNVSRRYVKKDV